MRFAEFVLENKSTGIKVWMKSFTCSSETKLLSAAAAAGKKEKTSQLRHVLSSVVVISFLSFDKF